MAHSRPSTCAISYPKAEIQARKNFESDSAQTNWVSCICRVAGLYRNAWRFCDWIRGGFRLESVAGLGCNTHEVVGISGSGKTTLAADGCNTCGHRAKWNDHADETYTTCRAAWCGAQTQTEFESWGVETAYRLTDK
jgi:hypothetical protein